MHFDCKFCGRHGTKEKEENEPIFALKQNRQEERQESCSFSRINYRVVLEDDSCRQLPVLIPLSFSSKQDSVDESFVCCWLCFLLLLLHFLDTQMNTLCVLPPFSLPFLAQDIHFNSKHYAIIISLTHTFAFIHFHFLETNLACDASINNLCYS